MLQNLRVKSVKCVICLIVFSFLVFRYRSLVNEELELVVAIKIFCGHTYKKVKLKRSFCLFVLQIHDGAYLPHLQRLINYRAIHWLRQQDSFLDGTLLKRHHF